MRSPLIRAYWKYLRPALRVLKAHYFRPFTINLREKYLIIRAGAEEYVQLERYKRNGFLAFFSDALDTKVRHAIAYPDHAIWSVNEASFFPKSGAVAVMGHPISESRPSGNVSPKMSETLRYRKRIDSHNLYVTAGAKPWNYYHWITEELPPILRIREEFCDIRVLIHKSAPEFVEETLRILGIPAERISGPVLIPRLLLANRSPGGWARPEELLEVRRSFFSQEIKASHGDERNRTYFISRARSRRSLRNESFVERELEGFGVQTVYPEEMSFSEQVQLFSSARVIVGTHGAGLTNILFAPENCMVIEIAVATNVNQCFESMASSLGQRYFRVFADRQNGLDSGELSVCSLNEIERLLDESFNAENSS